ncbi:hypothetical protein PS3A_38540 [Pseudomonas sp. 3A(2025)]
MPAASLSPSPSHQARDRVLDTALTLFATHGFHAIGLRDLAGHLGMHAGSLYHHIENKQCLLFELIESALSDLVFSTRRSLKNRKLPAERLQRFIDVFVAFSLAEPDRLKLLVRDAVYLSQEQSVQIQALKDAYSSMLIDIVAARLDQPASPPSVNVRMIASAIVGLLFGHSQWLAHEVPVTHLSQMLTRYVLGIIETGRGK